MKSKRKKNFTGPEKELVSPHRIHNIEVGLMATRELPTRGILETVTELTDTEQRVLGVLDDRSRLDLEQIAGNGRLSLRAAHEAVGSLVRADLVVPIDGQFGPVYEINRQTAGEVIASVA